MGILGGIRASVDVVPVNIVLHDASRCSPRVRTPKVLLGTAKSHDARDAGGECADSPTLRADPRVNSGRRMNSEASVSFLFRPELM